MRCEHFSLERAQQAVAGLCLLTLAASVAFALPPSSWRSVGVGGGGAMFAPSFSPHHADELFAACDMSELFHTTNLGETWSVVPFQEIQGARLCQVRFTNLPATLYALDQTPIDGGDTRTPVRSEDGGATWTPLPRDPTGSEAYFLFADPSDSNRLLLSDYSELFFSMDGGQTFGHRFSHGAAGNGLYMSGALFDGANIFIGTNAGLLVSTNGGGQFSLVEDPAFPAGKEIVSLAGAKQSGVTRFFALVADQNTIYPGITIEDLFGTHQDVYTLDWGQPGWVSRNNGLPTGDGYGLALAGAALNDISTAYVSGQAPGEEPIIYKTTNGGQNWNPVLLTAGNANVHTGWEGDQGDRGWSYGGGTVGFAVAPNDSSRAAFTDYGFIHLTTDGGSTWRQAYLNPSDQNAAGSATPKGKPYRGAGLENTSCWWLTWSSMSHIFACFTDVRGIRSEDGGNSWSFDYSGHTENTAYHCVKSPSDGKLYLATSTVHDLYQSTYLTDSRINSGGGRVLFSSDQGQTWEVLHDFGHPVIWLALDPDNPNRLYASVVHSTQGGIFVSENIQLGSSSTWTQLAHPPHTEGHPFNIHVLKDGTLVCTYSGRRTSAGFTPSSGVFISVNGGLSWEDRGDPGMFYWTKDLVVDPFDDNQMQWYVGVFSGWGGPPNGLGGLYRTANRGQSWTRISALDRVTSCAISPWNSNEMYLTTEIEGLWWSGNRNDPQPQFERVEPFPFRQPERVFFNPLKPFEIWVTSFGNGIRIGQIPSSGAKSLWKVR
jgi:photosystem II stability/assembly factor-like uncharacterized protein